MNTNHKLTLIGILNPKTKFAAVVLAVSTFLAPARAQLIVANAAFSIGSAGSADGRFNALRGVAIASNGDLFVTDALNYRIQRFTSEGEFVAKWGMVGQMDRPLDLAIDANDNVFVLDTYTHRVLKFDTSGVLQTQWGSLGSGTSQLSTPRALAVDRGGNVYVSDTDNHRVQKFNGSGTLLATIGGFGTLPGRFNAPVGIAVDNDGNIYVADQGNFRIQKFSNTGAYLLLWGSRGAGPGQFEQPANANGGPNDLAIDPFGNVMAGDGGNSRAQLFTKDGVFVTQFGRAGTALGQFSVPGRLTFNQRGDRLYIADLNNERVQVFNYGAVMQSITVSGANATLSWTILPGAKYQLQEKTSPNAPIWLNVGDPIVPKGASGIAEVPVGNDPQKIYRVQLVP